MTRHHVTQVQDPFNVRGDNAMSAAAQAVQPELVKPLLETALKLQPGGSNLFAIRVVRHKPGRRCLIEYDIESAANRQTVIGKVRAKGLDSNAFNTQHRFRESGIEVPEPLGTVPELHMWLQRKVAGTVLTSHVGTCHGPELMNRVAEVIHSVHGAGIPSRRTHSMDDELAILHERLSGLASRRPSLARRIARVLRGCERIGSKLAPTEPCGIHRDFYADQLLVSADSLCLLDLDLYCYGEASLDIGNFIGHLIEYSLRHSGNPYALDNHVRALRDRYLALSGQPCAQAIETYTTLTLARHIELSTRFPDRRFTTMCLLELCEKRLEHA